MQKLWTSNALMITDLRFTIRNQIPILKMVVLGAIIVKELKFRGKDISITVRYANLTAALLALTKLINLTPSFALCKILPLFKSAPSKNVQIAKFRKRIAKETISVS
jgi:hypothetical protein